MSPVFTVAESQELRGEIAGAHAKNLFVKDKKGRFFLITALEDARLDLKKLHEAIGASGPRLLRQRRAAAPPSRRRAGLGDAALPPSTTAAVHRHGGAPAGA
jgi:hypothetical protein